MRLEHLRALLWLRHRLLVNQLRRGGIANAVVLALLTAGVVLTALGAFAGSLLVGLSLLGKAPPTIVMYVWDGLVLVLLMVWAMGLLAELQRTESLALGKFLHLPVSPTGAFVINFVGVLLSPILVIFALAMLGLALGLAVSRGPAQLALLPLVAALLLALTALTYQFQGWLASLMANKRRRRTIVVLVTGAFILLGQLPNLINIVRPWHSGTDEEVVRLQQQERDLQQALSDGRITFEEFNRRHGEAVRDFQNRVAERHRDTTRRMESAAQLFNLFLPPGWLPLGARGLAEGDLVPALLGFLGLSVIAAASLWRSYRTTLALYTGKFTGGQRRPAAAPPVPAAPASVALLELRLPYLSEPAQAIALAGFRAHTRAPEVRLALLTSVLLVGIFGTVALVRSGGAPPALRPVLAFGAVAMVLFSTIHLASNQFGLDRTGFRVFVLCAAPRRDILLGKNLALAPVVLGLAGILVLVLQVVSPLRFDHFLAIAPQAVTMFLVFCMVVNLLSILAPLPIAAGSLKPTSYRVLPVLGHMLTVFFLPLLLAPALVPYGLEELVEWLDWAHGIPIDLLLSLAMGAAAVALYWFVVSWQGVLLQAREQAILETVATKAE